MNTSSHREKAKTVGRAAGVSRRRHEPGQTLGSQGPSVSQQAALRQTLDRSPRVVAQARLADALAGTKVGGVTRGAVVQRVGEGLAEPKLAVGYALRLREQLATAQPMERLELIRIAINATLTEAGVPVLTVAMTENRGFGEFKPETWRMEIPSSTLLSDDPRLLAEMVGTVYHEARHAEQYFRVAQRYALEDNEFGLFSLPLSKEVRDKAYQSRAQFTKAGTSLSAKTLDWAESLRKPEEVLEGMGKAEYAFVVRLEKFKATFGPLTQQALTLAGSLEEKDLTEIDASPLLEAIKAYRTQETLMHADQIELQEWTLKYRRMPHELDAHELGWLAEDIFRSGETRLSYDPDYENRFPREDEIWPLLAKIAAGVDALEELAQSIGETSTEEFDLLEPEPEEKATMMVARMTNKPKGDPEYKRLYAEALEYCKAQKLVQKTPPAKEDVLQQLHLINADLNLWEAVEKDYLSAISASLHRRTMI